MDYPDIEALYKEIGASPVSDPFFPEPAYTLPVIYDPSTKSVISDSANIARYLDKAYPETPVLIPAGTDAFHAAYDSALMQTLVVRMFPLYLPTGSHSQTVKL